MGIYHAQDEALHDAYIEGFSIYNFSFTFAAEIYPITIALPKELLGPFKRSRFLGGNILTPCGHVKRPFILQFARLTLRKKALDALTTHDLIIFDHSRFQ